jgi:hypothetical protein
MPRRKPMTLRFPEAGVVRRWGLRARLDYRDPYPSPWAVNVRLEGSLTTRLRGGSFTGIAAGARPTTRYRDRLLTFSTNAITATRMGDDTDTTLSADLSDTMRPALFQLSYGGATGGTVIALAPHKDNFLLAWTADETWVQQGDPHSGPRRRVSDEVGIIGADAWCMVEDVAYFMSSSGLYSVGADGSGLTAISEDKIPEDLTGIVDTALRLTYNHATRGVFITTTTGLDWFYDIARQQFWPYDTGETDSHVLIGPLQLGQANSFGRVLHLNGTIAASSADVTWRLVTGDTAEAAAANGKAAITASLAGNSFSTYVSADGTWSAGRSNLAYPRTRAVFLVLWLASAGSWAYESASIEATLSGRWR